LIFSKTGFPLDHTLIYCRDVGHARIGFGSLDHIGALRYNGRITMSDDIAPAIEHIGNAVVAHSKIYYDIGEKIGADSAVYDAVKLAVGDDRYFEKKDHPLPVVHDVGYVRLHRGSTFLKIVFVCVAVTG
jgi:hypothetical protein